MSRRLYGLRRRERDDGEVQRHAAVHRHGTRRNVLITLVAIGILGAVGSGLLYLFMGQQGRAVVTDQFLAEVATSLQSNATLPQAKSVTSSFGYSVTYDDSSLKARGQVTDPKSTAEYIFGTEYEGDELAEERPYSILKFELKTPEGDEAPLMINTARLSISTNIRDDYFTSKEAQPENAGKSKIQLLMETLSASRLRDAEDTVASTPTDIEINGIQYKYIRFTTTYQILGEVTSINYDDYYMTVQNDRPYWATITNIKKINEDTVPQLQAVIGTLSYQAEDGTPTDGAPITTSANVLTLPKGSSYVPEPLDSDTILSVVARNQPAVVRIGTAYCLSADLLVNGSKVGEISNSCGAAVGSGSFVSEDGYIATNGHVTQADTAMGLSGYVYMPYYFKDPDEAAARAKVIVDYFVRAGKVGESAGQNLITQIENGSVSALQSASELASSIPASDIRVTDSHYVYGIQLSNDPMRMKYLSDKSISFEFSDTIVEAKHVASDFGGGEGLTGTSVGTDVSILKAAGSYPVVELGSADSIDVGDQLTALGFPAFVDNGLSTTQSKTVPSVTQGSITQLSYTEADTEHLLIRTTVPISGGNSGGPAFNDEGQQIGLNTYASFTECPAHECFGNGIARDIKDFKALVSKTGITLDTDSPISSDWNQGIDAMGAGDYRKASAKFASVAKAYPANYLAPVFGSLAEEHVGEQPSSPLGLIFLIIGIAMGVLVIVAVVLLIIHLKKGSGTPPPATPTIQPTRQPTPPQTPPASFTPQQAPMQNPAPTPPAETPFPPQPPQG